MTPKLMKVFRKSIGWTQQKLADELGMARETIGAMERGQAPIERRTGLAMMWLASQHGLLP